MDLEKLLSQRMEKYEVEEENQEKIAVFLSLLRIKDEATYEHSIRVGLLGSDVIEFMHLDPKVLLYAGTLHDIGKALIDIETLQKTEGFDEGDMQQMKKHPLYGYQMLKGMYGYSAEVVKKHHMWQKNGYPKTVPKTDIPVGGTTKAMIDFYSRILALTDFYDALTSRANDKFGDTVVDSDKQREILTKNNPDLAHLIDDLYEEGIFGTGRYS